MINITNEQMQGIYQFLRKAIYEYKHHLTSDHKRIIIAMPNFLLYFLYQFPMYEYRNGTPVNELSEYLFEGVKIQPHYTNEIVVFYEDYHFNPEKFKPQIHIIKNEL